MKNIFSLCLLTICVMGFASCSNDDGPYPGTIWDFAPINIRIYLQDEDGNNLLNSNVDGNWVGEEMLMTYRDKTYRAIWEEEDIKPIDRSRYYMPHFYGMVWSGGFQYIETSDNYIFFGELDRQEEYDDNISFSVPSCERTVEFRFAHRIVWEKHKPFSDTHIIYDGQDYEGDKLVLVFPKNTNNTVE